MKLFNFLYTEQNGWQPELDIVNPHVNLVITFGSESIMYEHGGYKKLRVTFPHAEIVGCTAAAEVHHDEIYKNSLSVTAIEFASSQAYVETQLIDKNSNSTQIGEALAQKLATKPDLKHVFVLAEGILTNGLKLVQGLNAKLPKNVAATGGLACNSRTLDHTKLWHNDSGPIEQVIAIGFCGENIEFGYGSAGGWEPFGPKRKVTKSSGSTVYELDGKPALDLYKRYLGDEAQNLPKSGMKFPIMITDTIKDKHGATRGLNNVNETDKSLIFAGDIEEGTYASLMSANIGNLIDAGHKASKIANAMGGSELALIVSCIGRKVMMNRRTVEEIEDAIEELGEDCIINGFYSFGELCPDENSTTCLLQNQTITITTIKERV